MKLLVPTVSLILAFSGVLKVPHDDRGDLGIANKRFGKAVEQVRALTRPFLLQSTRFPGFAVGRL